MRKIGAFAGAFMAICLAGPAQAASTVTNVSGSLSKSENTCVSPIALFTQQLCSYSGGEDISNVAGFGQFRAWMGPMDSGGFYPTGTLLDPGTTGGFSGSVQGDGKVSLAITGSISIQDNNSPSNASDDSISGTLVIAAGERAASSSDGQVVESFTSITHTIPATVFDSATSNGMGGFDYVIGSAGFPMLLQSGSGNDDYPTEVGSLATGSTLPPDINAWDAVNGGSITVINAPASGPPPLSAGPYTMEIVSYAPSGSAGGNVGPNVGLTTSALASNLTCRDGDADANPGVNDDGDLIDDCNPDLAIGAGSAWSVSGAEFDNLILKLSTDAKGHIVSADAFYVVEYKIVILAANGTEPGSYVGGTLNFTGDKEAFDDIDEVIQDKSKNIDVLANDARFADSVTITLPGGGASAKGGTIVINGSPGLQADIDVIYTPLAGFIGEDTFDYTIDDGGTPDTAQVTVTVKPGSSGGNQFPNAPNIPDVSTIENQPVSIFLPLVHGINMGDGTPVITIIKNSANGTAEVSGTTIIYTPAPFFVGRDGPDNSFSFEYEIRDVDDESDAGEVIVTVQALPNPTANDDTAEVDQDASVNIPIMANDIAGSGAIEKHIVEIFRGANTDNPNLPIRILPVNGTAVLEADNTVTYTPDPGVSGIHIFQYKLIDESGDDSSTPERKWATVTITVNKVEPTATLPSDSGITSSGDSSSAIGPWSLAFLVIIVWLRRHLKSQFLVELATSGNRAGETC